MAKTKAIPNVEYRLIIARHFNDRTQTPTLLLTIETTKVFASFRYELSVGEELRGKELRYTILGLRTPQLDLPSMGTAQHIREYDNLKGKFDIVIENLNGASNTFSLNITKKSITVLKSPKSPFIEFIVQ